MLPLAKCRLLCYVLVAVVPVTHPGISKCALTLQDPDAHQADSSPDVWDRSVVEVRVERLDIPNYL